MTINKAAKCGLWDEKCIFLIDLRLLYDLLSAGILPFSNRSKYSSEYPLYGILLLLRWWWWLFVVSSWSSLEIAANRKKIDWMLIKIFVVNFLRLIKLFQFALQSFPLTAVARKNYPGWSDFIKKAISAQKWHQHEKHVLALNDVGEKERRRKKLPSLFFFELFLQLNHHLASNWKKVKSKSKIIVARKQGRTRKKKVAVVFLLCLELVCRPLGSLEHLQLIKIIFENSPGTFLNINKNKGEAQREFWST